MNPSSLLAQTLPPAVSRPGGDVSNQIAPAPPPRSNGEVMSNSTYPLQTGSVETCAAVRSYLESAGYTSDFLLSHFQVPWLHPLLSSLRSQVERFAQRYEDPAEAVQLAKLFISGY